MKAFELYENAIYRELVRCVGMSNVFILSAGWGLVGADYLLPHYDITFSACKPLERYKHRLPKDKYHDFRHLTKEPESLVAFASAPYLQVLWDLTETFGCSKTFYYATKDQSQDPPAHAGWTSRWHPAYTNWQYEAARTFVRSLPKRII
jgi:hypothetical protein